MFLLYWYSCSGGRNGGSNFLLTFVLVFAFAWVLKFLFLRGRKVGCTFVPFAVPMCKSFETLILHEEERLAVSFYLWLSDLSDSLVTATDYGFHFEHWMWSLNIEDSYIDLLWLPFSFYIKWWLGLLLANIHFFKNGKTLSHYATLTLVTFLWNCKLPKQLWL